MMCTDISALVEALAADIPEWSLLAVDGWHGSGKSRLGRSITEFVTCWWVDLDTFLVHRNGQFVEALELEALRSALTVTRHRVVLTGVCMRHVLALVGLSPQKHIYVKRMGAGVWADEDEATGNLIDTLTEATGVPPPPLTVEVKAYHDAYSPHTTADYQFLWSAA